MIYIDKRKFSVDGVDVYPDHESTYQFWYVPGTIRLAEREKKKALSYLWYTDSDSDSDGTGFLNFEVNTAVSAATLEKIRGEVSKRTGLNGSKINLSPVTYHSGSVNFSVLGPVAARASEELQKDPSVLYQSKEQLVWSAGSSSLVGDNAAVCSVKFTKEGKLAAAMKQAILSGSNSIAALYRLEFLALRPSVTFKVHGTLEKTIRDFQMSLGGEIPIKAFILDLGISAQWQRIMSKTDLKIEVLNFTGEEHEGLKWAQQMLLDYVLKNFFEVQLGSSSKWSPLSEEPGVKESVDRAQAIEESTEEKAKSENKDTEEIAKAVKEVAKAANSFIPRAKIRAAYYEGKQVNTIDFIYSEMKAKPYIVAPQALVLEGLGEPKDYITQVNRSQDPFGMPYRVMVSIPDAADRAKAGLQAINVQARYPANASRESQSTHILTVMDGQVTGANPFPFQYDARGSADVEYNIDYVFKPNGDWHAEAYQHSVQGKSDKGMLVAMPEAVFEFLTLDVRLSTDFIWERADQVVITLTSAKWKGEKRVLFQNGRDEPQVLRIRNDIEYKSEPVQYTVELRKGNKTIYSSEPQRVTDNQVIVQDRFVDHIPVFFTASFPDDSVEVNVIYSDGDFEWEDQFTLEKGQKKVQRVVPTLRPFLSPSKLTVEYEVVPESGEPFRKTAKGGQNVMVKSSS